MEVNRIIMTAGSVLVTIAAAVGLILSCVNVRHNNWTDITNVIIFTFLLIIGFVLLCANYMGVRYDRVVNILYYNTIPDYVVPPDKSETCIFSKLKKIFAREKSSQVYGLPVSPIDRSDSSSCDMADQRFHYDNCSTSLLTNQNGSDQAIYETGFMDCNDLDCESVNSCLDTADLSMAAAEKMIEENMLLTSVR
ncbi:hypothetical protein [Ehrlichia japonica]|uniref:Lipoprotein n=1 Tax=Ehrlichia japonica TaxID=391036 RepID=X5GBX9_9RICK|nr:hypothetical protein [Ehrlichia japonica]AHX04577.1 hypothetical protein EHF_0633 [Ehrlichia japonica]